MDQGDLLFGVSQAELMAWCAVNRTTAMRWKRRKTRAPRSALALVALRVYGDAGALLGDAWRGWRFGRDGLLYAPGWRRGFAPGEILALPYLYGEVRTLRAKLKKGGYQGSGPPLAVRSWATVAKISGQK